MIPRIQAGWGSLSALLNLLQPSHRRVPMPACAGTTAFIHYTTMTKSHKMASKQQNCTYLVFLIVCVCMHVFLISYACRCASTCVNMDVENRGQPQVSFLGVFHLCFSLLIVWFVFWVRFLTEPEIHWLG